MGKLPTLAELHNSPEEAFKNDLLKLLLNQPPHVSWIKKHPMAKAKNDYGQSVAAEYMPIDKIETLLDYIFQKWRVEVLSVQALFNSICTTVRVHYLDPVSGEWSYHDGVGASPVQTNAGASAADLGAIKAAAVQMAAPSSKSYAIKDAAQHLGKIFGRDLNRRDTVNLPGAYSKEEGNTPVPQPATSIPQQPVAVQQQTTTAPQVQYSQPTYGAQPQAPAYQPQQPTYAAQPPVQGQANQQANPFLNPNDL